MNTLRDLPRAGAFFICGLLVSCATPEQQAASAPATGRLGGAAIGAGLGSLSGHAGSGALLGLVVGGLGGDLYRADDQANRVIDPIGTVRNAPAAIREATRVRGSLLEKQATLGSRIDQARAAGDTPKLLIAQAEASRHEGEARLWERRMQDTAKALDLAAAGRLPVPPGDYESLQRNRTFAKGLHYAFSQFTPAFHRLAR